MTFDRFKHMLTTAHIGTTFRRALIAAGMMCCIDMLDGPIVDPERRITNDAAAIVWGRS